MAEITARELRRLQSLDTRLKKALEDKRAVEREVDALRRTVQDAESSNREAADRLDALVAENRQLASELESALADLKTAGLVASGAEAKIRDAQQAADKSRAEAAEAQAVAKKFSAQVKKLSERLQQAEAQLAGKGVDPVVPPERVSELIAGFVDDLRVGLGGLQIQGGEMRLKVGVALVDGRPGFVVPTPSSSEATINSLHEVALRFARPAMPDTATPGPALP
jgi:chromosome segregation ATPase